jgi:hypothetical protein
LLEVDYQLARRGGAQIINKVKEHSVTKESNDLEKRCEGLFASVSQQASTAQQPFTVCDTVLSASCGILEETND